MHFRLTGKFDQTGCEDGSTVTDNNSMDCIKTLPRVKANEDVANITAKNSNNRHNIIRRL